MTTIKRRLEALESRFGALMPDWRALAWWQSVNDAGLSIDEQEARALSEFPNDAAAIRAHFEQVRDRRRWAWGVLEIWRDSGRLVRDGHTWRAGQADDAKAARVAELLTQAESRRAGGEP